MISLSFVAARVERCCCGVFDLLEDGELPGDCLVGGEPGGEAPFMTCRKGEGLTGAVFGRIVGCKIR